MKQLSLLLVLVLTTATPLFAQQSDGGIRTELRLNGWMFENFFQSSDPATEEDITALGAEFRVAGAGRTGWSPYARANYLKYDDEGLDSTYGGRVGLALNGNPHSFDAYVDHQLDRPTFDIGDVFDRADVTTAAAEYRYRFTRNWEAGVEGQYQQQSFQELTSKDNEFAGYGGSLRYRGFGSLFSPEVGFLFGEREVDDPAETYDQNETYIQVRSAPSDAVYLSLRYRMREREYTTADVLASNFGRTDDRNQWTLSADWRLTQNLSLNGYYSDETSDSSREGRDFDTKLYMVGVTVGF